MAYSSNTPVFTPVVVNHIPMTLSSTPVYLSPHQQMVLIIKVQRTTLNVNKHIFHINMYVYTFLNYACQIFEGVRFKMYIILKLMSNKSIFSLLENFAAISDDPHIYHHQPRRM